MDDMDIIEYHLGVGGRRDTRGGEMGHGFESPIEIYIVQWRIVDYPLSLVILKWGYWVY